MRRTLAFALFALLVVAAPADAQTTGSPGLVISQVYGAGGNAGATYTADYVELFNRGTAPIDLGDFSLQYASATGTGNFAANALSGSIAPGRRVLVQAANGTVAADIGLT